MAVRIDRRLNLVVPIKRENGETIWVHSAPIGREVFEVNYKIIAQTFADICAMGAAAMVSAGPRIAALTVRDVAANIEITTGRENVAAPLMNEIRRLTNIVIPGPKGYETLPFDVAAERKLIDGDEVAEVEGEIVFFTVFSIMPKRDQREGLLEGAGRPWDMQISSQTLMELIASLPTSNATGSSGAATEAQPEAAPIAGPVELSVPH